MVLVPQLHLGPLAPNGREVVDLHEGHVRGLFEDDPRVFELLVALVELGKVDPKSLKLSNGLLGVDRLDGFRVGSDDLMRLVLKKLDSFEPLGYVVRVLPEQDRVEEQRPSLDQVFEPGHVPLNLQLGLNSLGLLFRLVLKLFHFLGQRQLLELSVRVEDVSEVSHRRDRLNGLLVDVPGALEQAGPDVVVGQRVPEVADLE